MNILPINPSAGSQAVSLNNMIINNSNPNHEVVPVLVDTSHITYDMLHALEGSSGVGNEGIGFLVGYMEVRPPHNWIVIREIWPVVSAKPESNFAAISHQSFDEVEAKLQSPEYMAHNEIYIVLGTIHTHPEPDEIPGPSLSDIAIASVNTNPFMLKAVWEETLQRLYIYNSQYRSLLEKTGTQGCLVEKLVLSPHVPGIYL